MSTFILTWISSISEFTKRMMWAACLAVCLMTSVVATQIDLVLNNVPAVASDIMRIYHDPELCKVVIDLKLSRRCDRPSFMVRLSGASLYLLDLEHQNQTTHPAPSKAYLSPSSNQLQYSYPPILDEGLHFIEVIVIHCKKFLPHSYRDFCIEKSTGGANVVTMPYSFNATPATNLTNPTRPRWILPDNLKHNILPLPTRHQVFVDGEDRGGRNVEDDTIHNYYTMRDLPPLQDNHHSVMALSNSTRTSEIIVCMVGCSHARGIAYYGNKHLTEALNHTVKFVHMWSRFPYLFDIEAIEAAECGYAVVGYGQWPFSEHSNYTSERYTHELSHVVKSIGAYTGGVQFFVRSMNYNPLGDRFLSCPPTEFRIPPVVDWANHVMSSLAAQHQVQYIDTRFAIGPLWDSSADWGHPSDRISTAEAHWILHTLFESSLQHQRPVLFEGPPKVNDNDVLRFPGSTTVYLYRNGTARAFPNGKTFMKMGFDFENVKAFQASKQRFLVFGDELPSL